MVFLDFFMFLISFFLMIIFMLVGVAYLTLLERKVLGYIQIRKGPNKVGILGIFQPFGDAIKLFSKEQTFPYMSNFYFYYFSPVFNLFISISLWMCFPMVGGFLNFNFGVLFFVCCSSLSVYSIMISGWSSNSNYSMLGGMRSTSQTISYEVSMIFIILSFLLFSMSFSFIDFYMYQKYFWFIFLFFPLVFMLIVTLLAETNRTPFDFSEGESELVSGFNVEYSSGGFALIFLAEYLSIIFMSFLCSLMFLGGDLLSVMFYFKIVAVSFFWLWVRGSLPRYRYDKLMYLAWKVYLPVSLNLLLFFFGLKIFLLFF
uniref:NADH-ubiquinone oxidoreductase chain 1 n=1 Tax=Bostrichoidea sp. 1 KM-2017 TaxID=2219275 RepID=A0A346RJN1_9COLE|nr:NADH dehydrogenase subunit 1 [Bostrichoidea sp. 1 KM-2017]